MVAELTATTDVKLNKRGNPYQKITKTKTTLVTINGDYQESVNVQRVIESSQADFKAVKEGNVWVTDDSMYQHTDTIGELITDLNLMLTGGSEEDMTFLHKLS